MPGLWVCRGFAEVSCQEISDAIANTPVNIDFDDNKFTLIDNLNNTKKAQFQCSGISASTTRTFTFQDTGGTIALLGANQTFSGNNNFTGINVFDFDALTIKDSDGSNEVLITTAGLTTDTSVTIPAGTDTFAMLGQPQTFTGLCTFTNTIFNVNSSTINLGDASTDVVNSIGELRVVSNFIQFDEILDPSAPATNKGKIYMKDNGSGKTQLVVRFPTGAVQVITTEP